jgi:pantetheine-phosphate adenylyltransferase
MQNMSKIAVFPGSFDPITRGHQSLVMRSVSMFDKIIVAVGTNTSKNYYFPEEERLAMVKKTFETIPSIEVMAYNGLTIDFCKQQHAQFILRGLRNSNDFEYERAIADMNHALHPQIETIFLITEPQFSSISSTIVREILKNQGNVEQFLPQGIL